MEPQRLIGGRPGATASDDAGSSGITCSTRSARASAGLPVSGEQERNIRREEYHGLLFGTR